MTTMQEAVDRSAEVYECATCHERNLLHRAISHGFRAGHELQTFVDPDAPSPAKETT